MCTVIGTACWLECDHSAAPIIAHISVSTSSVDELPTVPHIGDDNRGKRLFY
jgi:hypothetical protein